MVRVDGERDLLAINLQQALAERFAPLLGLLNGGAAAPQGS